MASEPQPLPKSRPQMIAPTVLRPTRGWVAIDFRELFRFKDLLFAFAGRDVKLRYRQTLLGVAWVVLQPLLAAGVLSFAFGIVAGLLAVIAVGLWWGLRRTRRG